MKSSVQSECFFNLGDIVEDTYTVPVILTEETKVLRYSWEDGVYDLILEHTSDAIDFTRKDIMPVLVQHERDVLPVGIWKNVRLEGKKLKADAVFDSEDELAMKIFGKIKRGFMQSFSIGVTVHSKVLVEEKNENGRKTYKATKWEPEEASVVTIPAIPGAKVGLESLRVNSASAQIKNNSQGESMSNDNTYTPEAFKALEATHAEALEKLNADNAVALESLKKDYEAKVDNAKLEQVKFSKEVFAMAFDRGLDKEVALSMLDKPSLVEAKAHMVDTFSANVSNFSADSVKKDYWADFK